MPNPFDQFDQQASGPVYGAPPKVEPFAAEDQGFQRAAAARAREAEARAREDQRLQRERFEWEKAKKDPTQKAGDPVTNARNLLTAAGVDLDKGIDPVSGLIKGSTSGLAQAYGAQAYGAITGDATDGMENIAKLQTIASDLTLQMTGGSLGSQISNADRDFIVQRVGNIADPKVPADARLAAWEQVKQRMANIVGKPYRPAGQDDATTGSAANGGGGVGNGGGGGGRTFNGHELGSDEFVRDGQIWANDPETGEQMVVIIGGSVGSPVQAREAESKRLLDERMKNTTQLGSGIAGAMDTATFGGWDELGAGADAFVQSLSGEGSIGELYARNVADNRRFQAALQERDPGTYFTGQLAGGVAIPIGAGVRGVRGMAGVGAGQGAAYSFGSGEGNALQRLPGAALGGVIGGGVGAGFGAAAPHVSNALGKVFGGRSGAVAQQAEREVAIPVIEAGQRQGIPMRQPDVRPGLRGDMAAAEKSPTAGPRIGDTLRSDRDLMAGKMEGIGPAGEVRDPYAMGGSIQDAMTRHGQRTKDEATALYSRVDKAAPGHVSPPTETVAAIDNRIAQLSASGETANAAEIKVLEGIKADLSKSGLSVDALQTQRRAMRQRLKDNGIDFGAADASYMDIMAVAGRELEGSLASNPKALGALKTANAHYAERSAFRKEVARQFLGTPNAPIAPEMAAQRFVSMTKKGGDYNRFSRGFAKLDPVEQADFSATIANGLGKTKSGEFGYGKFVSDLEGMNKRAIRDLFGEKGAAALSDLRLIAAAKSGTAGGLNHSNTGAVVTRNNGFQNIVLGAFGGGVAGVPGAMAGMAATGALERFTSARAARMLLNPDFTKWMRRMPSATTPEVIDRHFARLTSVAAKDAVFAADVKALQGFLAEAFQQSPGKLAAGQDENKGR